MTAHHDLSASEIDPQDLGPKSPISQQRGTIVDQSKRSMKGLLHSQDKTAEDDIMTYQPDLEKLFNIADEVTNSLGKMKMRYKDPFGRDQPSPYGSQQNFKDDISLKEGEVTPKALTEINRQLFPNTAINSRIRERNNPINSQERWAESLEAVVYPHEQATDQDSDGARYDDELMEATQERAHIMSKKQRHEVNR